MSERIGETPSHEQIFSIASKVHSIIKHPVVESVLESPEGIPGLGWGGKYYDEDSPSYAQSPTETHFCPQIDDIGVNGDICTYGKDSELLRGDEPIFMSMYFGTETIDVNASYLQIRAQTTGNIGLKIGYLEPGNGVDAELLPPDPEVVHTAEVNLTKLLAYIEQQDVPSR